MISTLIFRQYCKEDRQTCLEIFDANCPEFFAPNERADYSAFLDSHSSSYELCVTAGTVVGAFGLIDQSAGNSSLNWFLLDPNAHGQRIGSAIMERVVALAQRLKFSQVDIAASHKSSPFFEKFGAVIEKITENGWGPNMHRVDMVYRV